MLNFILSQHTGGDCKVTVHYIRTKETSADSVCYFVHMPAVINNSSILDERQPISNRVSVLLSSDVLPTFHLLTHTSHGETLKM